MASEASEKRTSDFQHIPSGGDRPSSQDTQVEQDVMQPQPSDSTNQSNQPPIPSPSQCQSPSTATHLADTPDAPATPDTPDTPATPDTPDTPSTPATTPAPRLASRSPPPGTINMSALRTALPDIALNSPSTNIIGTPYAHTTTNTPFEYPFPDTSTGSSPPAGSGPSPPYSSSHSGHRPGSPYTHPYAPHHYPPYNSMSHPPFAASSSSTTTATSYDSPPSSLPPPPPPPSHGMGSTSPFAFNLNLLSPKSPKFRVPPPVNVSPPPMPPSLKKKRWSLNILGRKRTSNPTTPVDAPMQPPPASPGHAPHPSSSVVSGAIPSGLGSGRPNLGGERQLESMEDTPKSTN